MNRRGFLKLIPAAAVTAAVLPQACAALAQPLAKPKATIGLHPFSNNGASSGVCQVCGEAITDPRHQMPGTRTISGFEIADNGQVSLDGQSQFPLYGADGGLAFGYAAYQVVGDDLIESRLLRGGHDISKLHGYEVGRGTLTSYDVKKVAKIRRDGSGYEFFDVFPIG